MEYMLSIHIAVDNKQVAALVFNPGSGFKDSCFPAFNMLFADHLTIVFCS